MADWKFDKILHGGDYNPDQWREYPDILKEDIRLMQLSKCDLFSVGIFAWSALEPREGEFNFGWLDKVLDDLNAAGRKVLLATPSGARPAWMSKKYPEVLRTNVDDSKNHHGGRHNHCMTSPIYREKVRIINTELAKRYGDHPAVVGWHISNEYSGECFCPLCVDEFRKYLKKKYGNIEELNRAYWSDFWSHRYNDFDEIEPPFTRGEGSIDGLRLDWKRYCTLQTVDFMKEECAPLKEFAPEKPITANFMEIFGGLDYWRFTDVIDVASWDSYPKFRGDDSDYEMMLNTCFMHDLSRSFLKKPFLLMESTPSLVNWSDVNRMKRPGVHKLSSITAVAHGSDSVQYFQWRQSRGSFEKHHGAVVNHEGTENNRVFSEVAELGDILEKLKNVAGSMNKAEAAIIYDWDNRWALNFAQSYHKGDKQYVEVCVENYRALKRHGINVDIVESDSDLSAYKLVIAPMMYLMKPDTDKRIREFVQNGGIFVTTYASCITDENSLCILGGFPGRLRDVLGIWAEETDVLYPDQKNRIVFTDGTEYDCGFLCDIVHTEGAETLAVYGDDFYKGTPAITCNGFGKGKAYYVASRAENKMLEAFFGSLINQAGIYRPAGNTDVLPENVYVTEREKDGVKTIFVMNYSTGKKTVTLKNAEYTNALTGEKVSSSVCLEPWGISILQYE